MKKTITTIAIILGLAIGAMAQPSGGGLFMRGETSSESIYGTRGNGSPMLPTHGHSDDQNGDAPLGGGIALMFCFGVLYLTRKRRDD